jgi:hypothetical protein
MAQANEDIRYYYQSLNYENRFYSNEEFNFYSDDVDQLQNGNSDNHCNIIKSENKLWSIKCSDEGIHNFIMTSKKGNKDSFDVNIEKRQYCFRWNFITTYSETRPKPFNVILPGEEFTARLWVVSGEENNISNIVPTNFEKDITIGLYMNGLTPTINFIDEENIFEIIDISFSKNEGYWTVSLIAKEAGQILFEIHNNNIHLFNCTVEKTRASLSVINKLLTTKTDDIEDDVKIPNNSIKIYQNPCFKNFFIAKSDNNYGVKSFVYTIDNFRTLNPIFLKQMSQIKEKDTIIDIIPINSENLFILTSQNKLYKIKDMKTAEEINIFPVDQTITNIKMTSFCTPTVNYIKSTRDNNKIENYNNYYVAYRFKDNRFYFTTDNFESINLTYVKQYGAIIDIEINPLNKTFILLMQNINKSNSILIYDPEKDKIKDGFNFETGISQNDEKKYFIDSLEKIVISDLGTNELFIYGKMR